MSIIKKVIPKRIKSKIKEWIKKDKLYSLNELVEDMANRKIALSSFEKYSKRFLGQVVVINGATGSLGKDICKAFHDEGAIVVACGRNRIKTDELITFISPDRKNIYDSIFDIKDNKQIEGAFNNIIKQHGKIDVLVNCAGGSARENNNLLAEQKVEIIDEIIDLNLRGPMLCARVVSKQMIKQQSGCIINFSSLMGLRGKAGYVEYGATKAGVEGLTRALAVELGKFNVRVNCVTPSYVPCVDVTEERCVQILKSNFLNTIGAASDVSSAVLFLASKEASFITGQNLIIDGGRSLGLKGE